MLKRGGFCSEIPGIFSVIYSLGHCTDLYHCCSCVTKMIVLTVLHVNIIMYSSVDFVKKTIVGPNEKKCTFLVGNMINNYNNNSSNDIYHDNFTGGHIEIIRIFI